MIYILTIVLITVVTIVWLGLFVGVLLSSPVGIIGLIFLGCVILIVAKLAYDKFTNKIDNHYDDHVNQ